MIGLTDYIKSLKEFYEPKEPRKRESFKSPVSIENTANKDDQERFKIIKYFEN